MTNIKPIFNRYTIEEVEKMIEEESHFGKENPDDEIEIETYHDEDMALFTVSNVDEGTWIGRYTIWKTEKNQKHLYSTVVFMEGAIHEVIECSQDGDLDLNHFVYIQEISNKEDIQSLLDVLEQNKQADRISQEEFEQSKKEVQTLRLQTLF